MRIRLHLTILPIMALCVLVISQCTPAAGAPHSEVVTAVETPIEQEPDSDSPPAETAVSPPDAPDSPLPTPDPQISPSLHATHS